jgi:hypothetical protein
MSIFNTINDLSKNSSYRNDDNYQLNKIKTEFEKLESFNGNEYSDFIGQLYEVSKDDKVLNLGYDAYKKDPKNGDEELKKIISDFKYDIVLYKNQDNTKENVQKLKDYIKKKTQKNEININKNNMNNGFNNGKSYNNNNYNGNNDNDNDNGFSLLNDNDNDNGNSNYNQNNYNYYNNNNNPSYNSIYNQNKPKYEDPNEINDYSNYNNYENEKKSEPIKVKFMLDGKEIFHEVKSDDSGEVLQLFAMQESDNPRLYTLSGKYLTYKELSSIKVGDLFKDSEPTLNIY